MRRRFAVRPAARAWLASGFALAVCAAVAPAYWSARGEAEGSAALASLSGPAIGSIVAGAEAVTLSWAAVTPPGGGAVSYYVTRDGGAPSGCPSAAAPSEATSCTDTGVALGAHSYAVTAVWRSWSAAGEARSATVSYGVATHLQLEASKTAPAAGESVTVTVTAKDAANNTVASFAGTNTVSWSGAPNSPGGHAPEYPAGATSVTFTAGVGKATGIKLYDAVSTVLTAAVESIEGSTTAFLVKAAATKKLSLTPPGEIVAGGAFSVALAATDEYGNPTASYTGTKTLVWSGPASSPGGRAPEYPAGATSVAFTGGAGTATGIVLYDSVASVTLTVKESTTKGSLTIAVKPAAAYRLNFSAIAEQTAGSAFNATLTAQDEYGNTATSYAGVKTLAWSGPASSPSGRAPEYPAGATSVTFSSGVGKPSSLKLFAAAAATLTVKEGSLEGVSGSFNVKAAAFKRIAWNEARTEPANKIVSALCVFECTAEGLGSEGKFYFKASATDEWGNLQASHGVARTVKLSDTCAGCSLSAATLTIAEGAATSAEAALTGAANNTWSGTLEATEGALKATAGVKH